MHAQNTKRASLGRSVLAIFAALLAFGLTIFGVSAPANAADGNVPDFTDGTINVYKHTNPGGNLTTGTGTETSAGGDALNGVEFTLYKVDGVDLTTVEGWDIIQNSGMQNALITPELDNNDAPTGVTIAGLPYQVSQVNTTETAGAGLASFNNLSPALYIVVEGNDNGNNNITTKAAPFFVALPINNNGEWQKTVNAYPKNVVAEGPQKSVATDTRNDGVADSDGTHTWTVTQLIPTYDATNPLTSFKLVDDLSAAGTTDGTVASTQLTLSDGTTLTAGTDYNAVLNGSSLEITFTATGLTKLASGSTLSAVYTTTGEVGEFSNSVESFINDKSVGTDQATTYLGKIVVNKKDAENSKALEGAEFKVCAVAEDGTNNDANCTAVDNITSGADGVASLDKLALGKYVIVETTPPAGYVLDQTPVAVTITETGTTVTQDITNAKQALPGLPLTGAQGKLLLTIAGAGLLLVAFGFIIVGRRRKEEEEAQA